MHPRQRKTCRLAGFAVVRFPTGHPDLIDPTRKAWNMETEWSSKVWRVRERHEPDQDDTCVFTLQTNWNSKLVCDAEISLQPSKSRPLISVLPPLTFLGNKSVHRVQLQRVRRHLHLPAHSVLHSPEFETLPGAKDSLELLFLLSRW